MNRNKIYLIVQSVICVLLAIMMIAAILVVYRNGLAAQEADPLSWIFSREIAAEAFRPIAPLFFAGIGLAIAGLILGRKDENGLRPVKYPKVENKAPGDKAHIVRIVLLIASIVLLIAGIFNGSAIDVFSKAVKICTECIGLG